MRGFTHVGTMFLALRPILQFRPSIWERVASCLSPVLLGGAYELTVGQAPRSW